MGSLSTDRTNEGWGGSPKVLGPEHIDPKHLLLNYMNRSFSFLLSPSGLASNTSSLVACRHLSLGQFPSTETETEIWQMEITASDTWAAAGVGGITSATLDRVEDSLQLLLGIHYNIVLERLRQCRCCLALLWWPAVFTILALGKFIPI